MSGTRQTTFLSLLPARGPEAAIAFASQANSGGVIWLLRQVMVDRIAVSNGLLRASDEAARRPEQESATIFVIRSTEGVIASLDLATGRMSVAVSSDDAAIIVASGWGQLSASGQDGCWSAGVARVDVVAPLSADEVLVLAQLLEAAVLRIAS